MKLSADVTCTIADQTLDPISMPASAEVLHVLEWGLYDFSTMDRYSRLESTSWDATLRAEAKIAKNVWSTFSYSYYDFNDDASYLEDLSGNLDVFRLGMRWTF